MKAAVIGGAGYAGGELLRLLLSHPEIEVTQVTSERLGGKFVHTVHPHLRRRTELKFQARAALQPVDVLFLAMPHGQTSREIDQLQSFAPTIIGAVEEEGSSRGARHLVNRKAPDQLVILEPSGWDAVTLGYKGSLKVRYRLSKPMGHGAGPNESAADQAIAFVRRVQDYAAGAPTPPSPEGEGF